MPQENKNRIETKIQLSEDELKLMQNSQWILTKNRIIEKIIEGFGALSVQMRQQFDQVALIESAIRDSVPKISKGEKYQGLPYVILDYPRIFGREHVLAIRTLYWWGNFCSITLHTKGRYQSLLLEQISSSFPGFAAGQLYLSFAGDEWNHDLNSEHYTLITLNNQHDLQGQLNGRDFIKLSAKVEFGQWTEMEGKLFEYFGVFSRLMEA